MPGRKEGWPGSEPDPLGDILRLQDRMNRLFSQSLARDASSVRRLASRTWTPAADVARRFCHHQGPKEIERYGRFAERSLSEFVTLRPGEALFEFRGRVDNPTPLRRSYRLWDRYLLPTHDETRIIMPASHRIEHSALRILPWPRCEVTDPTSGQKVLADCSIRKKYTGGAPFGLWSDYGFMGTWNPDDRINRLRIDDPVNDPRMKFYVAGDICEPWGGTTVVFEDPGGFVEGFVPCELTAAHYMVAGIGEISYADRNVAVCFDPKEPASVQVATPRTLGGCRTLPARRQLT